MLIYINVSDTEERVVNSEHIREIYRIGKTIGYTFYDGEISTATMESESDAIVIFGEIYKHTG